MSDASMTSTLTCPRGSFSFTENQLSVSQMKAESFRDYTPRKGGEREEE